MGVKLRGAIRCGSCGKPRGLGTHLCNPGRRRRRRSRPQSPVTWECPHCHKNRGMRHTCGNRGDFKKRRRQYATVERQRKRKAARARQAAKRKATRERQAARRRQAAAERRARDKARKQAAKTRKPRSRQPQHDYATCPDKDCQRHPCLAYRQGIEDCPLPHGG